MRCNFKTVLKPTTKEWLLFWSLLIIYSYFTIWPYVSTLIIRIKIRLYEPIEKNLLLPQKKGMISVKAKKVPRLIGSVEEKRILRLLTTNEDSYYQLPDTPIDQKTHIKVYCDKTETKYLLKDIGQNVESPVYLIKSNSNMMWYIVYYFGKVYCAELSSRMSEKEANRYLKDIAPCHLPEMFSYNFSDRLNKIKGIVIHGKEPKEITQEWNEISWTNVGSIK